MSAVIAIGDIHGMSGLLDRLLMALPGEDTLVFLGDYIDRGPDSRGVIDRLLALRDTRDCRFLRGNHEAMAMTAMENIDARPHWLYNGGFATVESYGGRITPAHLDFLGETLPFYRTDDFIFVHAGLRPGLMPEQMDPEELWWIREPFLSSDYHWGARVIHGHSPTGTPQPEFHDNRINLDTGAVYGGALTALLLPEMEVIAVSAP